MVKLKKEDEVQEISTNDLSKFLDYKICIVQVKQNSQIHKLETQVKELMNQGYEPYGDIQFDHCSESCMDVVQVMVKRKE